MEKPEQTPKITAMRINERYTKCASCRTTATIMILRNGQRWTATCDRHARTNVKRAQES